MKNIYIKSLILLIAFSPFVLNGQTTFWTEDFGTDNTNCQTQGQLVNIYSGPNGVWSMSATGLNQNGANTWYVSATEAGLPVGSCGVGCANSLNRTLHLGSPLANDPGAAYYADVLGATAKRAETPLINCSGYNTITLDYTYMMRGTVGYDECEFFYSADGGSNWSSLGIPAQSSPANCAPQGEWTQGVTINLPASANNNTQVKLGFNWVNDDNPAGAEDPSFAIDNIELSGIAGGSPPTAGFTTANTTICDTVCIDFTDQSTGSPTAWSWVFVGATPSTSNAQNPTGICYTTAGTYDVTLVAINANGADTLTMNNYITVNNCSSPNAAFMASDDTICENACINFTDQSNGSPTAWAWAFQGGSPSTSMVQNPNNICYSIAGTYNVTLIASNASGADTITQTIEVVSCPGIEEKESQNTLVIFPNPAKDRTTVKLAKPGTLAGARLRMLDITGKEVFPVHEFTTEQLTIQRSALSSGIYFIEINVEGNVVGSGKLTIE